MIWNYSFTNQISKPEEDKWNPQNENGQPVFLFVVVFSVFFFIVSASVSLYKSELSLMNDDCEWIWQNLCEFSTQKIHSSEKQPGLELSRIQKHFLAEFRSKNSTWEKGTISDKLRAIILKNWKWYTPPIEEVCISASIPSHSLWLYFQHKIFIQRKAYSVAFFKLTSLSVFLPEFGSLYGSEYGKKIAVRNHRLSMTTSSERALKKSTRYRCERK